jgi:hypothetical protein
MSIIFLNLKLLLFLLIVMSYNSNITFRILQSSILHFAPFIKLHHIVLLSDKPKRHVYTLDFTPINQTSTNTLLKLLFARNVPAEVRLRYIETNIDYNETILEKWNIMNNVNEKISAQLSKSVYNNIYDKQLQNIVAKAFSWSPYMNLYNHNCQHFSNYVKYMTIS